MLTTARSVFVVNERYAVAVGLAPVESAEAITL